MTQARPSDATRRRPGRWFQSRFFRAVLAILALVYAYVGQRLIGPSELAGPLRWLAWGLVAGCVGLVPLGFWARWSPRQPRWGPGFRRVHFTLLGLLFLLMSGLLLRDIGLTVAWIAGALPGGAAGRSLVQDTNLAVVAVVALAAVHGVYLARRTPRLKRVSVPIDGLPKGLEGLRIVQLSDLHIGPTLKRRFVESVVARVQRAEPDLIAITGDLVDGGARELAHDVEPLSRLRAPLGVYFAAGNHDYYSGIEPWLAELDKLGVTSLVNAHRVVERDGARLVVAGVTDPQGRMAGPEHLPDVGKAVRGAPEGVLRLLLAHQPKLMSDARGHGIALQLSGHTHGGQMLPWNLLVKLAQPVVSGLHRAAEGWIYVSRGTGFWGPPLRVGVPSEITLLTLERA